MTQVAFCVNLVHMIEANILRLQERIARACQKVSKDPRDIIIVCVTKQRSADDIMSAVQHGLFDIGESRVQEAQEKHARIQQLGAQSAVPPVRWHMIGHLQTNKIRIALALFDFIHSVDSVRLAQKINEEARRAHKIIRILIQVNTSKDPSKFGIMPGELERFLEKIGDCESMRVAGLMTMAPGGINPEEARPCFRSVRVLRDKLSAQYTSDIIQLKHLSMGMSDDFEVALEEGADIIRIGRALFSHE